MAIGHFFSWTFTGDEPQHLIIQIIECFSVIAPLIFFFSVVDGYKYTRSRKKYALRLLLCAIITQIPTWLLSYEQDGWRQFNVVFTLLFGLISMMIWDSELKIWQKITYIILLDFVTFIFLMDWMINGIPLMLVIHIFRDRPKQRFISYTVIILILERIILLMNFFSLKAWLSCAVEVIAFMVSYFLVTK